MPGKPAVGVGDRAARAAKNRDFGLCHGTPGDFLDDPALERPGPNGSTQAEQQREEEAGPQHSTKPLYVDSESGLGVGTPSGDSEQGLRAGTPSKGLSGTVRRIDGVLRNEL